MGTAYEAICNACGARFSVREGPGMLFDVLHCDKCGRSKGIARKAVLDYQESRLGSQHGRGEQSTGRPNAGDAVRSSEWLMANPTVGMSPEVYASTVELLAGQCQCGGHFRFGASPRCPECGSSDYRRDPSGGVTMYD